MEMFVLSCVNVLHIYPRLCLQAGSAKDSEPIFWTLWEKVRVGWSERTASKHAYYQVWNRSPVQVGFKRQVLGDDALGWPRGMGWGGRWEGGSGWGTHVNPWLIHVNVWEKSLQYCKVFSLQVIKTNGKNFKNKFIIVKSSYISKHLAL